MDTSLGYSASLFLRRHPAVGIGTNAEFLQVAHSVYNPFLVGMNIILKYSLVATTPQFHLNNILLPPMRASMDDLNIMSSTICGGKTLLSCCTIALNWPGLTFKADKSRSLVIIKGISVKTTPFSVSSPKKSSDFIYLLFLSFILDQLNF